jgi:triacylglycerol lipase
MNALRVLILLLLVAAFGACDDGDDATSNPVLLVHGWAGKPADMAVMQERLAEAGRDAFIIALPGNDNIENARAIAEEVATIQSEEGAARVDLVGFSMGGLSTRYYLKRLDGLGDVGVYVSFGTPHYGGDIACAVGEQYGGQMCPGSDFLIDLNAGDDTPGDVPYTTIWSDQEVLESAGRLDGGACFVNITGIYHVDEPDSPSIFDAVLAALDGDCPGTFEEQEIE